MFIFVFVFCVMTELGLGFDDDDLDTQRKKCFKGRDLPYHVKILEPRWFDLPGVSGNLDSEVFKFRGDYRYMLKDYAGAVEHYKAALDILPKNNVSVSQDLRESLARCYAYLGNHTEGLQISRDLTKEMSAEDEARQRQSLILLAFVCEKACLWDECVKALQKLCLLQPNYPHAWYQLGDAMLKLACLPGNRDDSPTDHDNFFNMSSSDPGDPSKEKDNKKLLLIIMMCYCRAKMFLESVMRNASDIITARNQKLIAEISEKINKLPLPEELKQEMFEAGTEEDSPEHKHTDYESEDVSDVFYHRFCKKHSSYICT